LWLWSLVSNVGVKDSFVPYVRLILIGGSQG
jgi:hypothetical protein